MRAQIEENKIIEFHLHPICISTLQQGSEQRWRILPIDEFESIGCLSWVEACTHSHMQHCNGLRCGLIRPPMATKLNADCHLDIVGELLIRSCRTLLSGRTGVDF